jgi:Common central domain of tyrosinase
MALGDGIRRNVATVSKEERDRLREAILALHKKLYPGAKTDAIPGGVSYWFKQDEIHDSTHVHFCPAFLPWHRELVNRLETSLREIDPQLSLHYWNWTQDPTNAPDGRGGVVNLFTTDFMGNAIGSDGGEIEIGDPWKSAGFYGGPGPYREDTSNPADPPQTVTRQVGANVPLIVSAQDQALLNAPDFVTLDRAMEGPEGLHNSAHGYIGGTLSNPHTSFRDPFVFLLHSNVDRLFTKWQLQPGHPERLDPAQIYRAQSTNRNGYENTKGGDRTTIDPPEAAQPGDNDVESEQPWWGIRSPLEPWSGPGNTAQNAATGVIASVRSVRPWAGPENQQTFKDSRDLTIVTPSVYD